MAAPEGARQIPTDYLYDVVLRAVAGVCTYDAVSGGLLCNIDKHDVSVLPGLRRELFKDGATVQQVDDSMVEAYSTLTAWYGEIYKLMPEDFNV